LRLRLTKDTAVNLIEDKRMSSEKKRISI